MQAFGHEAESLAAFDEVNSTAAGCQPEGHLLLQHDQPRHPLRQQHGLRRRRSGRCALCCGGRHHRRSAEHASSATPTSTPSPSTRSPASSPSCRTHWPARPASLSCWTPTTRCPKPDTPGCCSRDGHVELKDVSFRYLPDRPLIEDLNSGREARPAHRHRRPHRLRQDHPHQPAHAVL